MECGFKDRFSFKGCQCPGSRSPPRRASQGPIQFLAFYSMSCLFHCRSSSGLQGKDYVEEEFGPGSFSETPMPGPETRVPGGRGPWCRRRTRRKAGLGGLVGSCALCSSVQSPPPSSPPGMGAVTWAHCGQKQRSRSAVLPMRRWS